MTSRIRALLLWGALAALLLALWAVPAEAKGVRAHSQMSRSPCRREVAKLCPGAASFNEEVRCLERNVNILDAGNCKSLVLDLTACRADLLAIAADQDVEDPESSSDNGPILDCAPGAFSGDLGGVKNCLREWSEKREEYGEDLITENCTSTRLFARATKNRAGGHRKRRGSVSGKKSKKSKK